MAVRKRVAQLTGLVGSGSTKTVADIDTITLPNCADDSDQNRSAFLAQWNTESVLNAITRMSEGGFELRIFDADLAHARLRDLKAAHLLSTLLHQTNPALSSTLSVSTKVH